MKENLDYIAINKASWNKKTAFHIQSEFYDMPAFLNGKSTLNEIELGLLGDIKGKSILHLQCHFGQDSISLARMGANVTGIDLSDQAIDKANELAAQLSANTAPTLGTARFICCNIYDLPEHLNEQFDIVFTSYGTIGWLPDLEAWGAIINRYLKPQGKFVFVEFHPVVWMFDDDFKQIGYRYFNSGPIIETLSGTYADREAAITQEYVMWNHGIAEVVNSLIKTNLNISELQEYDYSPYNCFRHTLEYEPGKFRIKHLNDRIPMVYAIVAGKKQ